MLVSVDPNALSVKSRHCMIDEEMKRIFDERGWHWNLNNCSYQKLYEGEPIKYYQFNKYDGHNKPTLCTAPNRCWICFYFYSFLEKANNIEENEFELVPFFHDELRIHQLDGTLTFESQLQWPKTNEELEKLLDEMDMKFARYMREKKIKQIQNE